MVNRMNTESNMNTQRRPWLAVLLSLLLPGLGQLYCGATIQCFLFCGFMSAIAILSILAMAAPASYHPLGQMNGGLVIACLVLTALLSLSSAIDALYTARKTRADYRLKDYNRWYAYVLFWIAVSGGYLFTALYVRESLLEAFVVPSTSMYPTIYPGDRLLAAKNVYLNNDPAIGDVVIFRNPEKRSQIYIKRVVALEGDSVELRDDELYVNGAKLARQETPPPAMGAPAMQSPGTYFYELNDGAKYRIRLSANDDDRMRNFPKTVVPKHHCFVLGDNRDSSEDSRNFGAIPIVGIIGKASFIYAPARDWSRFGSM
jgi:signal peptidase I